MYYLKNGKKKIFIEDDNVFTQCPRCGKEMQIDLADAVIDGELDLYGISWFCETCTAKRQKEEETRKKRERRKKVTPNKERAIAALITYPTRKEAAVAAGITPRTLQDYFKDSEFLERYKAAFGDMVQDATRQAQQTINPALSTLREILEDKDEQSTARISAARAALEYALRLTEQMDILEQLKRLEAEE